MPPQTSPYDEQIIEILGRPGDPDTESFRADVRATTAYQVIAISYALRDTYRTIERKD